MYGVVFAPDGRTVATAGEDRRVLLWNPADVRPYRLSEVFAEKSPPEVPTRELLGHRTGVFGVAYSADGRRLVSGGSDNVLIAWDATSGTMLENASRPRRASAGLQLLARRQARSLRFARRHAPALEHRRLRRRARSSARPCSAVIADAILAADFSPDEKYDRYGRPRSDRQSLERATSKEVAELSEGHEYLASAVLFAGGGKQIVTSAVDGTTRVWDAEKGTELVVVADTGREAALAVSADGRHALSGAAGKQASFGKSSRAVSCSPCPSIAAK